MRTMAWVTCGLLLGSSALGAERRQVLAVFPPAAVDPEGKELALLIQARATAMLGSAERYSEIHLKQLLAMGAREGLDLEALDPKQSERAAKLLGAERVACGELERNEKGFKLKAAVTDRAKISRVEVQGDSDAPYARLVEVLDAVRASGVDDVALSAAP